MTINRTTDIRKGEAFAHSAPPGGNRKGVLRGRKEQITLTIAPELLGENRRFGPPHGAEPGRAHQPGDL
jgi:hypothetical protein